MNRNILDELEQIKALGYEERIAIEILKLEELRDMNNALLRLNDNVESISNTMSDITCYEPSKINGKTGKHFLRVTGGIQTL